MKRSPFLHKTRARIRQATSLVTNRYFWTGLVVLATLSGVCLALLDKIVMPRYTRHETVVVVPDLVGRSIDQAQDTLAARGLEIGEPLERFDRLREPNRILEQRPSPNTPVKPGRIVYVTVNRGTLPEVSVPRVVGLSRRGARNQLATAGLFVQSEEPDSLPSPYANAITRQEPVPGSMVQQGDSVMLWYGTGLGSRVVAVPDVTGLSVSQARMLLGAQGLRSVVLDMAEDDTDPIIIRQSREPGTEVREGFEIRLFTRRDDERGDTSGDNTLLDYVNSEIRR